MPDPLQLALECAIGGGVGVCIGLTGIGGGVLVVPALTLLLGLPVTTAVGTASAYIFLTNIFASVQHGRQGNIDFRLAHRFLAGAIPGNIAACLLVAQAKNNAVDALAAAQFQSHVRMFIAGVMVFSIALMLANLLREMRPEHHPEAPSAPPASPMRTAFGLLLGALVGAILGATSVGGGVVMVPLLILCFGLPARLTVGTSSYLALVLTGSTSLLSAGRGDVQWSVAGLMAVGSLGGVLLGIGLGRKLPENLLRFAMIALMLVAVAGMLFR